MAEKAIRSQGTVLYYSIPGSPTSFVALGKVTGISGPNAQSEKIDQTDLDDTQYARMMAGLITGGDVSFELNLAPSDTGHAALKTAMEGRYAIEVKITPPTGSLSLYIDSAYVTALAIQAPSRQKWTANVTISLDGGYRWA